MTQQINSSTTSSIAPEEAQTTAIPMCKCRCVNVLDLDFKQSDVVYGWTTYVNVAYEYRECVWIWMLMWMNVLDLDVNKLCIMWIIW
jgi:hypothetical protein